MTNSLAEVAMARAIPNPIQEGLDSLCEGNDSAIGRIFGVSRQSIGQWRKWSSIPRHHMRLFSELTGVSLERMLEYDEVMHGINFAEFVKAARRRLKDELD